LPLLTVRTSLFFFFLPTGGWALPALSHSLWSRLSARNQNNNRVGRPGCTTILRLFAFPGQLRCYLILFMEVSPLSSEEAPSIRTFTAASSPDPAYLSFPLYISLNLGVFRAVVPFLATAVPYLTSFHLSQQLQASTKIPLSCGWPDWSSSGLSQLALQFSESTTLLFFFSVPTLPARSYQARLITPPCNSSVNETLCPLSPSQLFESLIWDCSA